MSKQAKIQSLIVKHLLDFGTLDILLPDGIVLEIGIVQEDKNGKCRKMDDYCYVAAQREGRKTLLDSFNLGLSYPDSDDAIVFNEQVIDDHGSQIRRVDVI